MLADIDYAVSSTWVHDDHNSMKEVIRIVDPEVDDPLTTSMMPDALQPISLRPAVPSDSSTQVITQKPQISLTFKPATLKSILILSNSRLVEIYINNDEYLGTVECEANGHSIFTGVWNGEAKFVEKIILKFFSLPRQSKDLLELQALQIIISAAPSLNLSSQSESDIMVNEEIKSFLLERMSPFNAGIFHNPDVISRVVNQSSYSNSSVPDISTMMSMMSIGQLPPKPTGPARSQTSKLNSSHDNDVISLITNLTEKLNGFSSDVLARLDKMENEMSDIKGRVDRLEMKLRD